MKSSNILAAKSANPAVDMREQERKIDELVYQLYGLTEEEIKIVEGQYRKYYYGVKGF